MLARRLGPLLLALLLSLTLPASLARQLKAVEVPSPAAEEALLGLKSGGGGLAPDASGGLEGTTGTSYSSPLGYNAGSSGSDVAGGSGAGLGSGGDGTMPAVGGSEYDLVGTWAPVLLVRRALEHFLGNGLPGPGCITNQSLGGMASACRHALQRQLRCVHTGCAGVG